MNERITINREAIGIAKFIDSHQVMITQYFFSREASAIVKRHLRLCRKWCR